MKLLPKIILTVISCLLIGAAVGVGVARWVPILAEKHEVHEHKFSAWSAPAAPTGDGSYLQFRTCETCGLAESRTIKVK